MAAAPERYSVGAGAGFAGDRIEPAVRMARSGEVDGVVLECLAERTLIGALRLRQASPEAGYDPRLARRLRPLLEALSAPSRRRCRVISNLGAANPVAAMRAAGEVARSVGAGHLRIAAVVGDDIADRIREVEWAAPVDGGEWLGAHAYLGIEPIVAALAAGADVVITGRCADSSLFAAAPVHALAMHGEALAGALTVGHLLECAGQLTGGNLTKPGIEDLAPTALADLGYPIADIAPDGTATIRVLDGQPAALDPVSCTLQLLYEVHDPTAYVTPDAVLDFSAIAFEPAGANRMRMSGARARGRPERLKAIGFVARRGVIADVEIAYAGHGALRRARSAAEVLRLRLSRQFAAPDLRIDCVGVDSVLGVRSHPLVAEPPELRVHVSARCDDGELARQVEDEVIALTLSGPAGGCGIRSEQRPRIETVAGLIDRRRVPTRIEWATGA